MISLAERIVGKRVDLANRSHHRLLLRLTRRVGLHRVNHAYCVLVEWLLQLRLGAFCALLARGQETDARIGFRVANRQDQVAVSQAVSCSDLGRLWQITLVCARIVVKLKI